MHSFKYWAFSLSFLQNAKDEHASIKSKEGKKPNRIFSKFYCLNDDGTRIPHIEEELTFAKLAVAT